MKHLKFLSAIFILLLICGSLQAQTGKLNDELNKIRKQKYMEKVQVDETTVDKYFALFDENFKVMMELNKQKKDAMQYIEKNLDASDLINKME